MKHRPRALKAGVFALLLLAAGSGAASAAETSPAMSSLTSPKPALSAHAWLATSKVYNTAMANRELTMQAINAAFTKSVKRAKQEMRAAFARATTPTQKSAATARFREAIDRASAARQIAIDSLPDLPPEPGPQRKK